jgi:siroheme synthase (precorrin-2 oxidase/ferrochelatase)
LSGTANKVLVIAEQSKGKLQSSTLSSISAGLALKAGDVDVLVVGGGEGEEARIYYLSSLGARY